MKKAIIFLSLILMLSLLVACGMSDKIVATKTMEEMGEKYKATMEIRFEKDVPVEAKSIMEFEKEETAKAYYGLFTAFGGEQEGLDVSQSGKKLIMKMDSSSEAFEYSDVTKDDLIKELEEDGWTIK